MAATREWTASLEIRNTMTSGTKQIRPTVSWVGRFTALDYGERPEGLSIRAAPGDQPAVPDHRHDIVAVDRHAEGEVPAPAGPDQGLGPGGLGQHGRPVARE